MEEERDIRKVNREKLAEFLKHVEQGDEDESLQPDETDKEGLASEPSE